MKDTLPHAEKANFCCPHCRVVAQQNWYFMSRIESSDYPDDKKDERVVSDFQLSRCANCNQYMIWYQKEAIYPTSSIAPSPNSDMPTDVAKDFNEAREVLAKSPKSSAALLRLALQRLCKHLGQPGKNINDDIKALVSAGLSPQIQKSLDIVRVIGNNAVHPGEIDLNDDQPTALVLFNLLNFIVQEMITRPREIDAIYNKLPSGALDGIARRDTKP